MTRAFLNRVATAVPPHEVHGTFVAFAERLIRDRRSGCFSSAWRRALASRARHHRARRQALPT